MEQIQLFDRLVERECWNEIIKCVSEHWECREKLMVLGHGVKMFSPCTTFLNGDEAASTEKIIWITRRELHSLLYILHLLL